MEITKENLVMLLKKAEAAHSEFEKALGHKDEKWPEWYADFLIRQLEKTYVSAQT